MSASAGPRSRDGRKLCVAVRQAGFGSFIPVSLADAGSHAGESGFVLRAGSLATMLSQIPAALLVGSLHKTWLAGGSGFW